MKKRSDNRRRVEIILPTVRAALESYGLEARKTENNARNVGFTTDYLLAEMVVILAEDVARL